jgi:diaminopimelate epimerase
LALTKHHGLGNDFLVTFHLDVPEADRPALARLVCDRRTGLGADGLLVGESATGHSAQMVLYNADGSRPEMSGNGIRCFAHALALRRRDPLPVSMSIATDAGPRPVTLVAADEPHTMVGTVGMGDVTVLDEPDGWSALGIDPGRLVAHLGLGNPHSVVAVEGVGAVDLATLGSRVPHVNLEIVEPGPRPDVITMRVHERGAGITTACGTGACAAAFAARRWGLADPAGGKLVVQMDGGRATVEFDGEHPERVTLSGPTTFVGAIELPVPSREQLARTSEGVNP